MIVECAWCGERTAELDCQSQPVTHGICESCVDRFEYPSVSIGELLNEFSQPVFLVGSDSKMRGGNDAALRLVGKTAATVGGRLGGEVIDCAYSQLPGGCGKTEHCDGCTIRNTVLGTWNTGTGHRSVTARRPISGPDGVKQMRFVISTEKVAPGILLRIDAVEAD